MNWSHARAGLGKQVVAQLKATQRTEVVEHRRVLRPWGAYERPGPLAAAAVALFVLPVVVHGFSHWHASKTTDANALTPGLVRFLRFDVPRRAVVFADLETSYRISGYAPVYVCAAPPAHVADTKANRPAARRADVIAFLRTGSLAIPRRYGAGWLVLRRHEPVARVEAQGARVAYRDVSFVVFRLSSVKTSNG